MPVQPSTHVVLDHLLATLEIGVNNFTVCEIRRDWGLRVDTDPLPSLHYCLEGVGTLFVDEAPPIQLQQHTFVVLPAGKAYRMESGWPKATQIEHRVSLWESAMRDAVPRVIVGDGRQGLVTARGEIRAGLVGGTELFASLAQPLVVRFDGADGLKDQFSLLLAESARPGIGSRVLTGALLKQCLVLALRRWIELGISPLPWIAAMADFRLSTALHAIFEQPAVLHTVESLASMADMSRSAFAAAFRRSFGVTPMSLVKLVRLRRASELLVTTKLSVGKVARQVGFASRSNFSVSFTELHGMDPTRFRRTFSGAN